MSIALGEYIHNLAADGQAVFVATCTANDEGIVTMKLQVISGGGYTTSVDSNGTGQINAPVLGQETLWRLSGDSVTPMSEGYR